MMPYRLTMPEFGKYISCQIGGMALDALTVRVIFYAFLTIIMLPFAKLGFQKHQAA